MIQRTYTITVPEGYNMRSPSFYMLKSLQEDYVETRGRPQKDDDDIDIPDKKLDCKSKEKRKYYNRIYYLRKKNGLL